MSRMPPPIVNPRDPPLSERIGDYRRELRRITPPSTYRERVLVNVYRCLLDQCETGAAPAPSLNRHPAI